MRVGPGNLCFLKLLQARLEPTVLSRIEHKDLVPLPSKEALCSWEVEEVTECTTVPHGLTDSF